MLPESGPKVVAIGVLSGEYGPKVVAIGVLSGEWSKSLCLRGALRRMVKTFVR